jgi:hypothetical protein
MEKISRYSERESGSQPTRREGMKDGSHQTKPKTLDALRKMGSGSPQGKVESEGINLAPSVQNVADNMRNELGKIRETIETSDFPASFFKAQFISEIEKQGISLLEQEELTKIDRHTSVLQVPKPLQRAFVIARGKTTVEKVSNLSDKDVDTSKEFSQYKSKIIGFYEESGFVVKTKNRGSKSFTYRNSINLEKYVITAKRNFRIHDRKKGYSEPLHNSEILYNQLLMVLKEQKIDPPYFNLKRVIRDKVINEETEATFMLCAPPLGQDHSQSQEKVTYQFKKGSDEYHAMLGTPNVYGVLYLLKQHQGTFGKREITSIEVEPFYDRKGGNPAYDIIIHIGECK